ncbi:MAG: hypothetical protein FJ291_25115 [Planctomycetes bacterium]|nr:hypothetical protein [Planctomycetota bacterium]
MKSISLRLGIVAALAPSLGVGADWPMYRHDAQRSAASPEELPQELHLQWVKQYPPLEPAWPDQPRLRFDVAYEPIAAGGLLFFGSSANDSVAALDAATGAERWRFYADGPIRFAPAFWHGKLYFASDDGHLYCLDAATGKPLWKFQGGPHSSLKSAIRNQKSEIAERLVLGNGRLVNLWVARGAPVVHGGRVYFAAGIWPFEGVFIHCLDAETGEAVWTNDGSGATYMLQPHASPAFGGVAPQGYLAVASGRLLVPGGRSVPACFDLATGKFRFYQLYAHKTGGFLVAANRDSFANGGVLFDLAEGDYVAQVVKETIADGSRPVMTDAVVYGSESGELVAYDVTDRASQQVTDYPTRLFRRWKVPKLWKHRIVGQVHIKAGSRLFAAAKNHVEAIALPQGSSKPKVSWQARVAGTPATMLAADQRLFVATLEGHIYCFGAQATSAALPQSAEDVLVPFHAPWRYLGEDREPPANWHSPAFDDRRWAIGAPEPPDEEELMRAYYDGRRPPKKRLTSTYFRHAFRLKPGTSYRTLKLDIQANDGAVVFLNGAEVWRKRAPDPFSYWTPVSSRAPEEAPETIELDPRGLTPGANALALELLSTGNPHKPAKFDLELVGSRATTPSASPPLPARDDAAAAQAKDILRITGISEGHALVVGLRDGRLAEELARRSRLQVIALDPDPEKVLAVRRRLDAAGLTTRRLAVRRGDPLSLSLPPYFASLLVSEDPSSLDLQSEVLSKLFSSLRPYGGVACLQVSAEVLTRASAEANLERAAITEKGGFTLLTRVGELPGAADWTHQNADAAKTHVSKDSRVRLPLGILWFGNFTNEKTLPRHGHGPSEQIVDGRLFLEGPDCLRAMDIYTGRVLWEAPLPGIGEPYDNTDHQPGANAIGSNFVSAKDGIYVAYGKTCLRLDPATGERLAQLALPHLGGDAPLAWGFISLWDDVLVAGASPTDFETDPEFTPDEFGGTSEEECEELTRWLGALRGFTPLHKAAKERDGEWLARNLNLLLAQTALPGKLPKAPTSKARSLESAAAAHAARRAKAGAPDRADRELKRLNRLLLEEHSPNLPRKRILVGKPSIHSGTASRWLVALNRHSGKVLWHKEARDGFLHNSIAIGRNKLFCIDRLPEGIVRSWRSTRAGSTPAPRFNLLALDLRTGAKLWSTDRDVFGTWLAYSEEHDVLIQAGRASRDMLAEPSSRMIAYTGEDGSLLWDKPHRYGGPIMLHGESIITQGTAIHLITGEPKTRDHPLTGEEIPWTFTRQYGCGTAVAARHLLTFRSAAAGYFDLARDGGTGNFGGFRSGCTSNLIAAGGILNAPDYTRTCTCSYQNQCSLALVHTPEVETWTFNQLKRSDEPIRRVGINLGAPGDHLADTGTLWLDFPSVGGPSPHIPIIADPPHPDLFLHHSSWVVPISDFGFRISDFNPQSAIRNPQSGLPWVSASGATGLRSLSITLASRLTKWRREHPTMISRWLGRNKRPKLPPQRYTVRLHFVEPDAASPGDRVFAVALQGRTVLDSLDVACEAGGPRRPLVKEFTAVEVTDDLHIALTPTPAARIPEPVLCGVELVGEE